MLRRKKAHHEDAMVYTRYYICSSSKCSCGLRLAQKSEDVEVSPTRSGNRCWMSCGGGGATVSSFQATDDREAALAGSEGTGGVRES